MPMENQAEDVQSERSRHEAVMNHESIEKSPSSLNEILKSEYSKPCDIVCHCKPHLSCLTAIASYASYSNFSTLRPQTNIQT